MKDYIYLILPFLTWFIVGILKFLINCLRERRFAWNLIGYGGMPSNHSAIVSSTASFVAFREGINSPFFCIAATLAFIVVIDANGLRRIIASHAVKINSMIVDSEDSKVRERVGHSRLEILFGVALGIIIAYLISVSNYN